MTEKEPQPFWRMQRIVVRDLHVVGPQPLNEHFVDLIGARVTGESGPVIRLVPVRNLVTDDEDVVAAWLAILIAHPPPAPTAPFFVVEVSNRRDWAFDDTHAVRAWQHTNPDLMVAVDVLEMYESSTRH